MYSLQLLFGLLTVSNVVSNMMRHPRHRHERQRYGTRGVSQRSGDSHTNCLVAPQNSLSLWIEKP
jgi:hypothetical protein